MSGHSNKRAKGRVAAMLMAALLPGQQIVFAGSTTVLPTGGTFKAGSGAIGSNGNTLTITQSSQRGIIDWNQFSIGPGGTVNFLNGNGATLNRVTGGSMSDILGKLVASGSVYLINPNGVLIGPKGIVNTGGDFAASTLDLSNGQFMTGEQLLFAGRSGAVVKNLGSIYSSDGSVFLIGRSVENDGSIAAPQQTVGLAAGQSILLKDSSNDQRIFVQVGNGDVVNSGSIAAAEAELKAADGNIYALAGNDGGQIRATGTAQRNGHVWLVAQGGNTVVKSQVIAQNADDKGGQIETSGAHVDMTGATIKTGQGGSWLLDPVDLTIDAPAASTIQTALNGGTNVTEQTSAFGSSGTGNTASGNGDINVASNISWNSAASLTLSAYRDVNVDALISNQGSGNLTLQADNAATGTGTVHFNGVGAVDFSAGSGNVNIYYHPSAYPTATDFTSNVTMGTGALTSYMTVDSLADFENINQNLSGNYALNTDIDATGVTSFVPVGDDPNSFQGIFDGMNHSIHNLTVNDTVDQNIGPFGFVGSSGVVRNVSFINGQVSGTGQNIGGVVGQNWGTVDNVSASGTVTGGDNAQIGGIVGWNYSNAVISRSLSTATVSAGVSASAGGIAGVNDYAATIQDSISGGSVSASDYANVGGLAGYNDGTLLRSIANTTLTAPGTAYVGGAAGLNDMDASATNVLWNSDKNAVGSGYGTIPGITPTTTLALTSGALPSQLDSSVWISVPGQLPALAGQTTVIEGAVYQGTTNTPATVEGIAAGAVFDTTIANSGGYYKLLLPRGFAPYGSGVLASVVAGGSGNVFLDNVASEQFGNTEISPNSVVLYTTSTPSYSSTMASLQETVGSMTGNGLLFHMNNGAAVYNPGTLVGLLSEIPYTIDANISASMFELLAYKGLTLANGSSITSNLTGDSLLLMVEGQFTNDAGTSPLTANNGGHWLVSTTSPTLNSLGGLNYDFTQYNQSIFSSTPILGTGNGLLIASPENLTISLIGSTAKTYNGSALASLGSSNFSVSGGVTGDVIGVQSSGAQYANANAGTAKQVTASGLTVSAEDAESRPVYGYGLTSTSASANIGEIDKAALTASVLANNKVYNGTTTDTGSIGSLSGVVLGDNVSVDTSETTYAFANKNAGTHSVSETGATLAGSSAGNYTLSVEDGSATITPAALTASVLANNKVYNGTTTATGSIGSLSGVVLGDNVSVDASETTYAFSNKNAGTHNVSETGAALTGSSAGNYTLSVEDGSATITPAALTASVLANNKVYDGTAVATGSIGSLNGVVLGDAVSVDSSETTYAFANKNAGTHNVAETGAALTGSSASNYTLSVADGSATITPAQLTASVLATDKVYDGTTTATASITPLAGIVSGDDVQVNNSATAYAFANKNAGTHGVSETGAALTGSSASNYTLSVADGSATITPAQLTASVLANNKVYDGTTAATGSIGSLAGVVAGDTVRVNNSATTYTFSDKNAGTHNVSEAGATLAGSSAGNYTLSVADGSATITPAQLTYVADATSRPYGVSNPALTGSVVGFVPGETQATATAGSLAFTSAAIATSPAGTYAVTGSGLTANNGNYTFTQALSNAAALNVASAGTITISVSNATRFTGQNNPQFTATVAGQLPAGVDATTLLSGLSFQTTANTSSAAGTYQISATSPTSLNYSVSIVPGQLVVVDNSPVTLPTQVVAQATTTTTTTSTQTSSPSQPQAPTTGSTPAVASPFNTATGSAVNPNTLGSFDVSYSDKWATVKADQTHASDTITSSFFLPDNSGQPNGNNKK